MRMNCSVKMLNIVAIITICLMPGIGCTDSTSKLSSRTPEETIAIFDESTTDIDALSLDQVYYTGEDNVIGDLIKKDILARSQFANKLNELHGNKPFKKLVKSEIKTAVDNAFMDGAILCVTLSSSGKPSDAVMKSLKGMRLSMSLPQENKTFLLQKRNEQWFVVHPYIAWNRGFRDKDIAFLKDRIQAYSFAINSIEGGEKTVQQIFSEHKEYEKALKTAHGISPYQW